MLPLKKRCRGCKRTKRLELFGKDKYRPDGRTTRCLVCKRKKSAQHRSENLILVREQQAASKRRCYAEDPQKALEQHQQWLDANPQKKQTYRQKDNAAKRAKYAADPAATLERQRKAALVDAVGFRAKKNARRRKRWAENPQPFRDKQNAWLAANPGKRRTYERTRRALKANAPINDLTHDQWLEIQAAQDHRCYYCRKRRKGKLTQDHLTPLSKGGSHTVANVIAACGSCNSRKWKNAPPIPVQPFLLTVAPARKRKAS